MQNTKDYYHLLDFNPMALREKKLCDQHYNTKEVEVELNREIVNIKRVMGILTLEEMSEEERDFVLKENR